jgi:phosphopantetheinyl transferase
MSDLFYIGLSLMSSLHTQTAAERRKSRSAEGWRIMSLLDALPSAPPVQPKEAIFQQSVAYEPGGRPHFSDYHADFNISHSRNMVVAAIQMKNEKLRMKNGKSHSFLPSRIGCDVQYLAPGKSFGAISRRFFHAGEQAYIEEDPAVRARNFYRIWVLKEAWLKLHGFSIFDMAKVPAFSIGGVPQTSTDESGLYFYLYELSPSGSILSGDESYMLAVVRQRASSSDGEAEPEIRWFSDTTLMLKRVENVYAAQSPVNTVIPKM